MAQQQNEYRQIVMKLLVFIIILISVSADARKVEWTKNARQTEIALIQTWERHLGEISTLSGAGKIEFLSSGLLQLGEWMSFDGHNPAMDRIYASLQIEFISIPGHARYFADKIEWERKSLQPGVHPLDYDRHRQRSFETLAHLPSPETVKVLGNFLRDERDREVAVWSEAGGEKHSSGGRSPNCNHAGRALGLIGLRNAPYPKGAYMEDIGKWGLWWEDIQSGKRTFSFLGQKVEYRFKPDSTWETIALANAPDDAPRAAKSPPAASADPIQPLVVRWAWIIAVVMLLLAGMTWVRLKRFQHRA